MSRKKFSIVSLMLCVFICLYTSIIASATSEESSTEEYYFSVTDGKLTIVLYIGESNEVIIPSTINGYPVTNIAEDAFYGCTSLTSVSLPDSITNIESGAFYDCTNLKTINLPDSITSIGASTFRRCTSLENIELPDKMQTIEENLFYGCLSLKNIEMPDSITSIGYAAFQGCTSLTTIQIPDSVTNIAGFAFSGCTNLTTIEIPDIQTIEEGLFYGCSSLKNIEIPDSLTSIGYGAFQDCTSLEDVVISGNVETIESNSFKNCSYDTRIFYCGTTDEWNSIISDNEFGDARITCMGDYVSNGTCGEFLTWYYNKLGQLTIDGSGVMYDYEEMDYNEVESDPSWTGSYVPWNGFPILTTYIGQNVEEIDPYAIFGGKNIYVDDNNSNYCDIDGVLYSKDEKTLVRYAGERTDEKFEVPYGVKKIGKYAFDASIIREISIPGTVEYIGDNAFAFCGFSGILLPESLETIGNKAFYGCCNLLQVSIPNSVTSIGDLSFGFCEQLSNISIGNNIEYIGRKAFFDTEYYDDITNWEDGTLYIGSYLLDTDNSYNTFNIKNGTTCIASCAFDSIYTHDYSITIPKSVKYIGNSAFAIFDGDIYYNGTKNEFKQIIIGEENYGLEYHFIHFKVPITDTMYCFENNEISLEIKLPTADITSNALLIVCGYNNHNKLEATELIEIYEGVIKAKTKIPSTSIDKIKIFIWKNLKTLKPLADVEVINIQ